MPYLLLFYPVFATEKGGVDETIGQFGTVLDVNTGDVFVNFCCTNAVYVYTGRFTTYI